MTNTEQLKIAESYLGSGGGVFRKYCGLGAGQPYCCAFVVTIFAKAGNSSLFCDSRKVTYCPTAIKWCRENLAQIPMYLAMPSDIIFFDWQPNDTPDHIGFVRERKSAVDIYTVEGNTTSRGIVANRIRPAEDVQAVYRPHFKAKYDTSKPLAVDGLFDYSSIAMLQMALGVKVDGVLGLDTVKALQKKAGVTADGAWGTKTSKAVQRMTGVKDDGYFGEESVKALQKWINANVKLQAQKPQPNLEPIPMQKVDVDGYMGADTVKATQKMFGTIQDGEISGQIKKNEKYYPNITAVTFGGGGSFVVERIQKWLGVPADGILGRQTILAWQGALGVEQDGIFGKTSVRAWQLYLNTHDTPGAVRKTSSQKILEKATEFAYPTNTSKADYPKGNPRPAYKKGLNEAYPNRKKWSEAARDGASCDVYVGATIRESGVDKSFPRGRDEQVKYLANSNKWCIADKADPGCIIIYQRDDGGGHICIALDGNKVAEAANGKYYPKTTSRKSKVLSKKGKKWVKIYRAR